MLLFTTLSISLLCLQAASGYHDDLFTEASVYCEKRECTMKTGVLDPDHAIAIGTFNDTLLVTGWGVLDIEAKHLKDGSASDADLMFAAGFLEGAITAKHIEIQYNNTFSIFFSGPDDPMKKKVADWFAKNRQWTDMMVKQNPQDAMWRHVGYINAQLDGLYAGYKFARVGSRDALDEFAMYFLNGVGDLIDLKNALNISAIPDWRRFTPEEAELYFYGNTHCSALVKVLPGYENIFMSHSSWFAYQATDRIYKHYFFDLKDVDTAAKRVSFSSYGGFLESLDDFYLMDSGLVMLQTTNNIFNTSLYELVHEATLLAWQRVRISNMMAYNGLEWAQILTRFNSGTYNNQYMIINLNLIKAQEPLPDGTLWVAEQIPGQVSYMDLTNILRTGYWPSYNVPYFQDIYEKSGYPDWVKKHGLKYSYQLAPRAEIFRRDANNVKDMESFKNIMRYNDYTHDPYSGGSPMGAICSRGDLDKENPRADGCYDTKVTDLTMARALQADIISGPTLGTGLKPFSWTGRFANISHAGLPSKYNFDFIRAQPRSFGFR